MVHLDYRDAKPIYIQIIDNFHSQIAAGILQPGDKLRFRLFYQGMLFAFQSEDVENVFVD